MLSATALRRAVTVTTLAVAVSLSAIASATAQSLVGAGATFPQPLYERYFEEYKKETGIEVKYIGIGSGGGIRRFINETVDFGASNTPPTPEEIAQMQRGLVLLPTAGNAIAVIYNLREAPPNIRISRDALVKIFTGQIGNWKQVDPRLPNRKIQVVVHGEGSGTSFIFTRHLSAISNGRIEASPSPDWGFEVFATRQGNSGVASAVALNDGAIGYVVANYALANNLFTARIENKAGEYVRPTLDDTQTALLNTEWNDDFTIRKADDPEEGYPIIGATWLLFYKQYPTAEMAQKIRDLAIWILENGREYGWDMYYSTPSASEDSLLHNHVIDNIRVSP